MENRVFTDGSRGLRCRRCGYPLAYAGRQQCPWCGRVVVARTERLAPEWQRGLAITGLTISIVSLLIAVQGVAARADIARRI